MDSFHVILQFDGTLGTTLVEAANTGADRPEQKEVSARPAEVVQKPPGPTQEVPPIAPQQVPQALQMMIQAGIMPPPPMQPEVVKHLTEFFSHDSDNRLTAADHDGHRKLIFRMTALIIGGVAALGLLSLPLIGLLKNDAAFSTAFLDRHIPYLVALVMALLGGAGLRQILK